jgi:hypothetical protein
MRTVVSRTAGLTFLVLAANTASAWSFEIQPEFGAGFSATYDHFARNRVSEPQVQVSENCVLQKVRVRNPNPGPDWVWTTRKICD